MDHLRPLGDWPERERREEAERPDHDDDQDQQKDKQGVACAKRSRCAGDHLLAAQVLGHEDGGCHGHEAREQHHRAQQRVEQDGVAGKSAQGAAVVGARRCEGVQDLRERVRPGSGHAIHRGRIQTGDRASEQDREWRGEHHDDGPLHFIRLDFLAGELGRAADHEAGDKDGQNDEGEHAVQAAARAAEDDFAQLHDKQHGQLRHRRRAVEHRVDRSAGRGGRKARPDARTNNAEAGFLSFQRHGGIEAKAGVLAQRDHQRGKQQADEHGPEDGPALLHVFERLAKGEAQRSGNEQNRNDLEHVRERCRVLVWMGGVGQKVAPAVRPALFNGDLAGRQTGRERLLGNDFRVGNDRSVDDHDVVFLVDDGVFDPLPFRVDGDWLQQFGGLRAVHRLDDTLRNEQQGKHEVDRDQNVKQDPGHVFPEVANRAGFRLDESAHEREEHGHAGGWRQEVLHAQTERLHDGCHLRFGRVRLPVRVGDKRGGCVERLRDIHADKAFVVDKACLRDEHQKQNEEADQRKQQQRA